MTQTPDETGVRGGLPDVTPPPPHGQGLVQAPPTQVTTLPPPMRDIGKVRSTGTCFLLMVVTLGFYSVFWFYGTHAEMQRHRHSGIGGGVALLLGLFLPVVMFFITPSEVSAMYAARGQRQPVSAATGCWIFLPFVGVIVWFVKTNGALNDYWRSLGAV